MEFKTKLFLVLFFSLPFISYSQTLMVAAASNTRYALEEIKKVYEEETGVKVNLVFASSGKLTSQIMNGAPYHVFLSANKAFTDTLFRKGYARDLPKAVIQGSLIVVSNKKYDLKTNDFSLLQPEIKSIAIANPKTAPYGIASVEMFKALGIFEVIKDKLVFVESISQVNQHIFLKSTDAGLTSKSVIFSNRLDENINWIEADTSLYKPILQYVILLKSANEEQAKLAGYFIEFLMNDKAQTIFKDFGYYSLY